MADKPNLPAAICRLASRWRTLASPWLIGGSTGLMFQQVRIQSEPRDLDIYIDPDDVMAFHEALQDCAADTPSYSRTERYRSTLSHYRMEGVTVELVAGFEVQAPNAHYRVNIRELQGFAREERIADVTVRFMPLAHELVFNLLRERPDRYEPIAEAMRSDLSQHMPCLAEMIANNVFGEEWLRSIAGLLHIPIEEMVNGSREV